MHGFIAFPCDFYLYDIVQPQTFDLLNRWLALQVSNVSIKLPKGTPIFFFVCVLKSPTYAIVSVSGT